MSILGDKMKEARLALGLTLEDVGNAVGVGKSVVSKWERGETKSIRDKYIPALSQKLGISETSIVTYAVIDELEEIGKQAEQESAVMKSEVIRKMNDEPEYIDLCRECINIRKEDIQKAIRLLKVIQ